MATHPPIAYGVFSTGTYHQYQNRILFLETEDWNLLIDPELYPAAERLQLQIEISQGLIFVYTWLQAHSDHPEVQLARDSIGPFPTWAQFFGVTFDLIQAQETSAELRQEAQELKFRISPLLPALKAYLPLEHKLYLLSEIIDLLGLIWLLQKLL